MDVITTEKSKVPKKLFIGVPIYGAVDPHFFKCALALMAGNWGEGMIVYPHAGDSLVSRARNHIARMFLESDATHLLFIDSDLIFSDIQIQRILNSGEDLVGGVYCKKQEGPVQVVCNSLGKEHTRDDGLCEVGYVGTGFMCIARRVFELMIQEYGDKISYMVDPEHTTKEYDFFSVGPHKYASGLIRYLSEDWFFCQRWLDIGGKVWMDMRCILKHSGNAIYPLSYQEKQLLERHTRPVQTGTAEPTAIPAGEAVPT